MYPRTEYEMTQDDLDAILAACKPTPVMFLSGGTPMGNSPQENANIAWGKLGKKMGFDHMTVRPDGSRGMRFFSAIPTENETQRNERLALEAEEKKRENIKRLESEVATAQERLAEALK